MSFLEWATDLMVDRVAPRMVLGKERRNQPSRADLEEQARAEIEARINMGRPAPEEWQPRARRSRPGVPAPVPAPAEPERPRRRLLPPTRPVDVHSLTLAALRPEAADRPVPQKRLTDRLV